MHCYQVSRDINLSISRLSKIKATLPYMKFWVYVLGISSSLCWVVEFATGIMIWQLKETPIFPSIFLALFLTLIAVAMESAFHNIKKLNLVIQVISIVALIGYGALLLDALEYMGLMPGIFGKGISADFFSSIQNKINEFNKLLLYLIFPSIYLLIGYLIASLFRAFKDRFRDYNDARLRIDKWKDAIDKISQHINRLDAYSLVMQKPIMQKEEFIKRINRKYKQALKQLISLIEETLSVKDDWVRYINVSTKGNSTLSHLAEFLSQVKTRDELISLKEKAEAILSTY